LCALSLAKVLAKGGTLVTYGGMSKAPLKIPTGLLIFNDLIFKGFWMTRWSNEAPLEKKEEMFENLGALIQKGKLTSNVKFYEFASQWRDAFAQAGFGKGTKKSVLLMSQPSSKLS